MYCSLHFLHMACYSPNKTFRMKVNINTLPNTFCGKKKYFSASTLVTNLGASHRTTKSLHTQPLFIVYEGRISVHDIFCSKNTKLTKINTKFLEGAELLTHSAFDKQSVQLCCVTGGVSSLSCNKNCGVLWRFMAIISHVVVLFARKTNSQRTAVWFCRTLENPHIHCLSNRGSYRYKKH